MKKKTVIIIAVITAVLIAAGIGVGAIVSYMLAPPLERLERAINRSYKAIAEHSDAAKTLEQVFNGGSVEVKGNLRPIVESLVGVGIDVGGTAKLYFGSDDEFALKASVGMNGIPAVDALLYVDSDKLTLSSDALTDGEMYGLRFDDLAEKWDASVFGKNGKYALDIDAQAIADELRIAERCDALEDDINAALSEFESAVLSVLKEYSCIDTASGSMDVGGTSIKTFDIILTLEGEAIVDAFAELLVRLKQIDSLEALLSANSENILWAFEQLGVDIDLPIDEPAYRELSEILDTVIDTLESVKDTFHGALLSVKVHISKISSQIVGIELEFMNADTEMKTEFVIGPTWDHIDVISFAYSDSNGDTVSLVYSVEENTNTVYKASLTSEAYGEPLDIGGRILWNKASGALDISFNSFGTFYSFDGGYTSGNRNKTVIIDKLTLDGNEYDLDGLEITFSIASGMPKVKKYHDILNMDGEEVDGVVDRIGSGLSGIFTSILG